MKRIVSVLVVLAMFLVGCAKSDISPSENELRSLFAENIYCATSVFACNNLAYDNQPVKGDNIYKVTDTRFSDYNEFERYIKSVYCSEETQRLLHNFPYEGTQVYLDIDGMLCIDTNNLTAKGYFVDWTDFDLQIENVQENKCYFTATGFIEEPAEQPTKEEYSVKGVAVYEDSNWVLERMLY